MWRRFLNLFRPNQLESDLREELEFHRGQTKGSFGNMALVLEDTRAASTIVWLETLVRDARYGLRQLRRTPVLSTVAILSLALGIGANTAIFTLINAVMLQNLPVEDPARLVLFNDGISEGWYSGNGFHGDIFSYAAWEYFRDHNESFQGLCAFREGEDRLMMRLPGTRETGPKEETSGHLVSGNYFAVLGVPAAAGRMLTAKDDTAAAPPVAVISYNFWRRRFHLEPSVIGKLVDLNGAVFTIIGVAPREFFGERVRAAPDFWLPLARQPEVMQTESLQPQRDHFWLNLMGRLKPGVTRAQAQATLNTQLQQFYTAQAGTKLSAGTLKQIHAAHIELKPGGRGISWMRFYYSEPLHVLMGVVALVLLIACANVATLLLARASARRHELFTRLALGASRARLIRQQLTESIVLALLGGAAGWASAWWGANALSAMVDVISVVKVRPDPLVLGFTLAISILTGIAFGFLPAVRSSRMDWKAGMALKSHSPAISRLNPARALVVLQLTLSCVLLVGGALLTRSLLALEHQDLGYHRDNLLLVRTDPRLAGYQVSELYPLYRQLHTRLNSLPGVLSAAIARYSPLSGSSSSGNISLQGYIPPDDKNMDAYRVEVGPQFFETLGTPLLLGRPITERDTPGLPPVAVVNESFVQKFMPNQNPIGRHFSLGAPFKPPGIEIIGVASDSKYYQIAEKPKPMIYFSAWQQSGREPYVGELLIRTSHDASGAAAEVRKAIHEIDSRLPILKVTTLREQVYESLHQERTITQLSSFFGLLALLLASIGLYGTMAYSVTRRTNEIGIRMALGAQRPSVLWMVLKESVVLMAAGLGVGIPLSMGATRWIKSFLFGVPPVDPTGIGAAILLLAAVSTLAGYLPARRATKVDPMAALRYE
ncbi:MAG TPA: ABC transporter permease [Bryobacteraceae bacterium]|nr:ABC transporter permease [Bryobacteraceae bacterium]